MALEGKSIMHRSIQVFLINAEVNAEVGQIKASEMGRAAVSNKTLSGVARGFDFFLTLALRANSLNFGKIADLKPASGNRMIKDFCKWR
jgi:hypothetical protein